MSKREEENTAFVISPIGDPGSEVRKRADLILKYLIEPSASECGYKTLRADKISEPGIITSQIISHVLNDPLVIADLTGHNPNVFYELAIRHAIKRPIVQLIQEGEKIPFDVSTTRTVQVDHQNLQSVDEAKKEIVKQIHAAEKNPAKVDSPISVAVDLQLLKESEDPQRKALAEMRSMIQQVYSTTASIKDSMEKMTAQRTHTLEPVVRANPEPDNVGWVVSDSPRWSSGEPAKLRILPTPIEEGYLEYLTKKGYVRRSVDKAGRRVLYKSNKKPKK